MTRFLLVLALVACSKTPPPPPVRIVVKEPCPAPSSVPAAIVAPPDPRVVEYEPAGSKRSIEDRAYSVVRKFAERDGFTRRFVHCKPWWGGGQNCDICYHHPKYYGQNRVWCDDTMCEAAFNVDDPRNADVDWSLCEK